MPKKFHMGEITDNKKCPNCGREHTCDMCDDWHYCGNDNEETDFVYPDCKYWWRSLNGIITGESFEGDTYAG